MFVKEPVSEKLFQELKGKFKFVPIRMTGKFPHTDQLTFGLNISSIPELEKTFSHYFRNQPKQRWDEQV